MEESHGHTRMSPAVTSNLVRGVEHTACEQEGDGFVDSTEEKTKGRRYCCLP